MTDAETITMNIDNHAFATFTGPGELRITRLLPGPIERVWQYLTETDKRARWFAGGVLEPKAGGRADFIMRHSDIAPNETPPDKYKHVHEAGVTLEGRVLQCEPLRRLVFTFAGDDSEVTVELKPQGSHVLLVLTHLAKGEDLPDLCNFAAGWHTHLAQLVAQLEGASRPPFWPMHARLLPEYEKLRASGAQR